MTYEANFPVNKSFYEVTEIKTFKELIDNSANFYSDRPAYKLRNKDGVYYDVSYKKLRHDVYYLGNSLIKEGYSRSHIAVVGLNSYKWSVTYLAVTCSNNVIVPIDKELTADNMVDILNDSDSCAIFGDAKYLKALYERKDKLPKDFKFYCFDETDLEDVVSYDEYFEAGRKLYKEGVKSLNDVVLDPNAMTSLLFTSGTTGVSKGVCLSMANICGVINNIGGVVKVYPEDQLLSVLPIHHTYECTLGFLFILSCGACIAFSRGLRYLVQDMADIKPTIFITVPLMIEKFYARIMKKIGEKKGGSAIFGFGKAASSVGRAFGSKNLGRKLFNEVIETFGGRLRLLITGASALDPRVAEDFINMGIDIYIGYGLTECAPLVIGNNDKLMLPNSIGTPLPNVQARIHEPDDLGVGEIWIKGPMVMLGYYKNQEATDEVLTPDGWFKTGDLGVVDKNNCYRITGRCKNVIVTKNGKNIFPEEVEIYLNNNPFIEESMVYGVETENDETTVSAQIYPNYEKIKENLKRQEITQEEIREQIAQAIKDVNKKLPSYKKIMDFDIRESEFIKTTTQKIKRYANLKQNEKEEETNEDSDKETIGEEK